MRLSCRVKAGICDYIEMWYNKSKLDFMNLNEYEKHLKKK